MNKFFILFFIIIAGGFIIKNIMDTTQKKAPSGNGAVMKKTTSSAPSSKNGYIAYDEALFQKQNDKRRVLFFHAKWCPTCKIADKDFTDNTSKIPEDLILFRTDYDTEKELIAHYGITYQHTFVYVDSEGNELKKWNGGGVSELLDNISAL